MDESLRHHNPNPILGVNPISKLFFWWLNPIFKTGYKRKLETEDMFNVCNEDSSDILGDRLEKEWNKELEKRLNGGEPSLLNCFIRMFGVKYCLYGLIVFIEEGTKIAQPLLLGQLIQYFTPDSHMSSTNAYLYAMGVSLCAMLLAIVHHPYLFGVQRMGMQLRIACCSLLYRKSLRLSTTALGQTTTGQIVNLMSNDVSRFDTVMIFLHYIWIGPAQVIPVLYILWHELGPSAIAGLIVLIVLIPVQIGMGKLFSKFRHKTAIFTDERVKVMNEIISGIRVIKMYCWETPFGKHVENLRRQERRYVWSSKKVWSYTRQVWLYGPRFMYFCTFVPAALLGVSLYPARLYICIALLFVMAHNLLGAIPQLMHDVAEGRITIQRLQTFLLLDELKSETKLVKDTPTQTDDYKVVINDLTARWKKYLSHPTLSNVAINVGPGKLMAVIGPVGAGKSSLLLSILGEVPLEKGNIKTHGKITYVSQQAWVFSASLRQNIVFGNKFVLSKYNNILKACALNKDINLMPDGDRTVIGDRGISLSGGQRARITLARALYIDADIYLLDDPLSAVDALVGRHLFQNVIQGILKNKVKILVTHQLQYLKEADDILILKDGKSLGHGTYEEMSSSGIDFSSLLKRSDEEKKKNDIIYSRENTSIRYSIGSTMSLTSVGTELGFEPVTLPSEERIDGDVGWKVYYEYIKNGTGLCKFLVLLVLNLATQGLYVTSDWWLAHWSDQEEDRHACILKVEKLRFEGNNMTNVTIPEVHTHFNISIFTSLIVTVFILGLFRALLFFKVAVDSSMNLHNKMFNHLLRSPIRFFDTNPVGRILNRFSKDTGQMDDMLPMTLFDCVQCFLLISGIVLMACVVIPWLFIALIPIAIMFIAVRRYYIRTSRHVKRLEATTRSPVFSHLSASLHGLTSIRAYGVQSKFQEEFDEHQNLHTESWFLYIATSRWLAIRLDWMCAIFVTSVAFSSVFLVKSVDAGMAGLALTYSMTLMGVFQWAVRQSAEVENQMISVERVLEYSSLPSEAPLLSEMQLKPAEKWPNKGEICVRNVNVRYSFDGPLVLKNISFSINSNQKVGIVGRTGAGKSSLIATLFRLVEPVGSIIVDNIDILTIGLHDLRSKISIIPQDPVLFTGSLRKNLDPFEEHSESALWSALEEVQLKPAIKKLYNSLEHEVSEGGINFSVGQRQLICLARAILRKNKILLVDEATANVDPSTDALIQTTIREKFKHCTVLTIAHRLNTIMDSDKVMVLEEGEIVEFDHPFLLLDKVEGLFYKMVQQTGETEAQHLSKIAKNSYLTMYRKVSKYYNHIT